MASRKALVTGAASGIGRAIAAELHREGFELFLLDHDQPELETACKELSGSWAIPCDLRQPKAIAGVFAGLRQEKITLDVLVNNAGVAFPDRLDLEDLSVWDRIFEINLLAVFSITREALSLLKKGSVVVNISSSAAKFPIALQAAYSAAKAGVRAFSQALREELRPRGVRISTIFPGPTKTQILRSFPADFLKEHKILEEPRLIAVDVARAVLFAIQQAPHAVIDELDLSPAEWSPHG